MKAIVLTFDRHRAITEHLIECAARPRTHPDQTAEFISGAFTDYKGQTSVQSESINFVWYPWAINASQRWLLRRHDGIPAEDVVRVRRSLGHLVVDLRQEALREAETQWAYIAAETLYALSAIRPS